MSARERLKSEIARKQIRQRLESGMSVQKIADEIGKSFAYVSMIAKQERQKPGIERNGTG